MKNQTVEIDAKLLKDFLEVVAIIQDDLQNVSYTEEIWDDLNKCESLSRTITEELENQTI
jgi:hypothetical protein